MSRFILGHIRASHTRHLRRQWSWPLWLPVQAFGIFPASVLVNDDASTPWADEIEQKIFASAVGEQSLNAATVSLLQPIYWVHASGPCL